MKLRYVTVDVFTDSRFGGNPLAVVLDARGLGTEQMQAIALEFNYSETTFILPAADAANTAQVRIFTPRAEMPFAGHPNVGTAFAIANNAPHLHSQDGMIFEEKAGLVPMTMIREGGKVVGAELTAPERLSRRSMLDVADLARCLNLRADDVLSHRHAPQVVSVGLPFVIAELGSRAALRAAKPNIAAFAELFPVDGADAIYIYSREVAPEDRGCDISARMFAPLDGVVEDPATGSATVATAALLADREAVRDTELNIRVMQGVDMGRPSILLARASKQAGAVRRAHVGGQCVSVMEGEITI